MHVLENSTSHDPILFGILDSPIISVSNPLIEPKFDGFSIKIGEISCAIINPCCNIVKEDDCMFVDSQEDEKLEVLEPELKNRCSDFVVSEASQDFIADLPVRLSSAVYGVAATRPSSLSLFVGKQSEQLASSINIQFQFLTLHDESIVDFDPGGRISSCLMFSVFTILR